MARRHVYGVGIALAGLVLAGVQLAQGLQQLDGFVGGTRWIVFTFETAPFVLVGLTLTFVGYWVSTRPVYEVDLPRIAAWGVGSTLLFASVAALIVFSQQVKPTIDILDQASYIAMNHVTVGAVVGVLLGLYDARSRVRQRQLQSERDRVELFAKKAMDINTYGRELNRSESIDAVSALCIEAVQGLLGVSETAFVIVDDVDYTVVDDTVVTTPEGALADLARQSRGQEPTTVVSHETLPDAVQTRASAAASVLVTDLEDSSVVLLALTDDATFDEEAVQLLELLLTHAATALDHIHHTTRQSA